MKKNALLILLGFWLVTWAQEPYREITVSPFYPPSENSIISPNGRFYVNAAEGGHFEVFNLATGDYVLRSKYIAWTPPYPQYKNSVKTILSFSPDDKYLLRDCYAFPAKGLPLRWVELWNLGTRAVERFLTFDKHDWHDGARLTYSLPGVLSAAVSRSRFRDYTANQRITFSPDGSRVFTMYPRLQIFSYPDFSETTGDFNLVGIDNTAEGSELIGYIGAPAFMGPTGKIIMPIKNNTFVFNNLFNSIQDYVKIDNQAGRIETSSDGLQAFIDGKLYLHDFYAVVASYGSTPYMASDNSRFLTGGSLLQNNRNRDPLLPLYPDGNGNVMPSSTREFLFITDTLKRAILVHSFVTGALLQSIRIEQGDYILRDTDKGNRLIIKNEFSGKIRVFERK